MYFSLWDWISKSINFEQPKKGKFNTLIEMVALIFHSSLNYFGWNDSFFQKQS